MDNLEILKKEIEIKFGKKIVSPSDFDVLYLAIKKETEKEISVSTLKRIWGYVKYDSKPRREILNILARYIGFLNWSDFINSDKISDTSGFLTKDIFESKDLTIGDILKIEWAPNRECELKYQGEEKFLVLNAKNSKIQKGDLLNCSIFAKGEPMLCSDIIRNENLVGECYVAARRRGLQSIKLIKSEE